jgi:arabinose-5-phosphate isomerase
MLEKTVADVMCSKPTTIDVTEKAVEALSAMENPRKITFLPVVASGNILVGLVTLHGLVSAGL